MIWLYIILGLLIVFFIFYLRGKPKFWKIAASYPTAAYNFFLKHDDIWYIIHPGEEGTKPTGGDWDGPFYFVVPEIGRIKLYGKVGKYEDNQEAFIMLYGQLPQ